VLSAYAAAGVGAERARLSKEFAWASLSLVEPDEYLPLLKGLSGEHRARWILDDGDLLSGQLSYIGRALPEAAKAKTFDALRQHKLDYSGSHVTPTSLLTAAENFSCQWAKKYLRKLKKDVKPTTAWPTLSSCYERTSSKGGLLSHLIGRHGHPQVPLLERPDRFAKDV